MVGSSIQTKTRNRFLRMTKLHSSPYLLNSFLSEFPELVLRRGGKLSDLCEAVDLPVAAVTHKHKLIPFDKFIELLEVAANTFNYPEIAFDLASRQNIETLGPISVILEGSENFEEALHRILRYFDIITSGFQIEASAEDDLFALVFHVDMPQLVYRQQFQNYLLAGCVSIIRNLMGAKFPIRGCYFTREEMDPVQRKKQADFFGCPVAYSADVIRLVFSRDIMKEPVKKVPIEIRNLMLGFQQETNLEAQLESILPIYLASGNTSLNTIAKAMGYSTGTFRRRLRDASISFSDTLNSIKLSHANQYLESTHYSLNDISSLLGYRNQSAFTRSYIRWCGITPSQYRKNLQNTPSSKPNFG